MKHKAHVSQYKKDELTRVKSLLQKYKIIAIADMTSMPSVQLQRLRSSLKGSVLITMSKGSIIKIALEDLKDKIKNIHELETYVSGMPALLLTNENPFKLSFALKKNKSKAPAKGGQIAPNDIMVQAGPTPFPPGPIIGELGQIGIKATITEGKVTIKEDCVVVKEGNVISTQVANLLTRLSIEPMEIGINVLAALENGIVYGKDLLTVDEEDYKKNIVLAFNSALNLAVKIGYTTKGNIKVFITKATRDSKALADSKNLLSIDDGKKN